MTAQPATVQYCERPFPCVFLCNPRFRFSGLNPRVLPGGDCKAGTAGRRVARRFGPSRRVESTSSIPSTRHADLILSRESGVCRRFSAKDAPDSGPQPTFAASPDRFPIAKTGVESGTAGGDAETQKLISFADAQSRCTWWTIASVGKPAWPLNRGTPRLLASLPAIHMGPQHLGLASKLNTTACCRRLDGND